MSTPSSRNPLLTLKDGTTVQTIGDVHLGRTYVNGVPLENRGKIEEMQREAFQDLLDSEADIIVQVGDIFDKFQVDESVTKYAADTILSVAKNNPDRIFIFMRGNHDASKDATKVSSFDLFTAWLEEAQLPNLSVMAGVTSFRGLAFIGWSPEHSAAELAAMLKGEYEIVFGHWDVNLPDNASHFNLIPTEQLKGKTELIVTGHDHKPGELERDGIRIIKTGSILPLAHGEETEEDDLIYTITLDEYDPKVHTGKIVRFILSDGEEVPEGDFLQLKVVPNLKTEDTETETETESFDLAEVLQKFLLDKGIEEKLAATVVERFSSRNVE